MSKRTSSPSDAVKLRVLRRDRFTCNYCGIAGTDAELEIDHITPVSKGGSHHMANLTTACRKCNQKKSNGELARAPTTQKQPAPQGMVGLWLHTLEPDNEVKNQGTVVGEDGEFALVQLFSWVDGRPTSIMPLKKSELYDSRKCRLFASGAAMREAGDCLP